MSIQDNIATSVRMCEANEGAELALLVCGSHADAAYWQRRAGLTKMDVFRANGTTRIHGIAEEKPLGSFGGTLNAWRWMRRQPLPDIALMSMVFGEGRRLSPFTQALGNRKAAFTTPRLGKRSQKFLNAAELANFYTSSWLYHLRARGFNGVLVKWGDESILSSLSVPDTLRGLADVDVVRFVWRVRPTSVLAAQKDWLAVNRESGLVIDVLPRQPLESLVENLPRDGAVETAVNLGSLALTPGFLDAALAIFEEEVEGGAFLDWDPHVFVALLAPSLESFLRYCDQQAAAARPFRLPPGLSAQDFFRKMQELRSLVRHSTGRELRVGTLDFGDALWLDFGLQPTLGEMFESLPQQTDRGSLLRSAFGVPERRDEAGNILIESKLPPHAKIESSVLLRSAIKDPASRVKSGVFVNSKIGNAIICGGGAVIDSRVKRLELGRRAVAFKVTAEDLSLGEGGRAASVALNGAQELFTASEMECNDPRMFDIALNQNPMSFASLSRALRAKGRC